MGAYNFKQQFEADIMADRKRHTIRAKRKDGRRPKPGELLSLYLGMRTKGCRLMKRRICTKVQWIEIHWHPGFWIVIDGEKLTRSECENLARSDGFPTFSDMMAFWEKTHQLPFSGDLIHWESDAEAARNPTSASRKHRPETERSANKRKE